MAAIQPQFYSENSDSFMDKFDQICFLPQQFDPNHYAISSHLQKQSMEFDQFILLQNEKLRFTMQEQRKQQIAILVKKYESRARFLLKQKEDEIAKANKKTIELQDMLRRMEIEKQMWERLAREKESAVESLNGTIERLRESAVDAAEDAESCCGGEPLETTAQEMMCRGCCSRKCDVVLLPCRHLCCCKYCVGLIHTCPVCTTVKKSGILINGVV